MTQIQRDINEILAGIYDALEGREPSAKVQAQIDRLDDQARRAAEDDWHGWECYCQQCCE